MHRRIPDEDYLLHEPQKSNKNEKETINKWILDLQQALQYLRRIHRILLRKLDL
jgi:hypothetical protein